ncbi:hypothetical protein JCM10908_006737 [Rhodotorula pacifica]|uniref:uncharacterized protein n=1 Tax=Rhodotorula pacifica TaxID=1495444 RepID=UPI00317CE6CE
MLLPDHLKLAALLNAPDTRQQALTTLASEGPDRSSGTLRALLPYLSRPTLLSLRESHATTALGPLVTESLYDLLDTQRDWVVSPECPAELRDSYLVRVFGEEWNDLVKPGMTAIAADKGSKVKKGLVLDSSKFTNGTHAQPCANLDAFKRTLKEATGGLLEKLDWSNVVLGGGAVLSILTGKADDEVYKGSDVDLFLFGLQPDELIPKVNSVIEQIQAALPPKSKQTTTVYKGSWNDGPTQVEVDETSEEWREEHSFEWGSQYQGELLIVKGFNAFTLVPPRGCEPRRPIQIVLHNHATAFDAFAGFDLDACAVGYTGKTVIAVPRAVRSLSLGGWSAGINFFDLKVCRKGDPSASTASSRALKYLPRGFSLALPSAALKALENFDMDYVAIIATGKDRAKLEAQTRTLPDPATLRTDELAGLGGLLRREANLERKLQDAPKPVRRGLELDYGLKNSSWLKPITEDELRTTQNGTLAHEYWEYHINEVAPSLGTLLIDVDKAVAAGKKQLPGAPKETGLPTGYTLGGMGYIDYVDPYVASFDREFVLGLKKKGDDPFGRTWTQIRDLQYIIKLPVSLLSIVENAEHKMGEILARGTVTAEAATTASSGSQGGSSVKLPDLSTKAHDALNALLSDAGDRILPQVAKSKPIDDSKKFVPESFPGPYRRTGPAAAAAFAKNGGKRMLTPLTGPDGKEIKPKKNPSHVYRVATIAGLWQFKGLDVDIDNALNLIWHAWSITARAAMSLPWDIPPFAAFTHGLDSVVDKVRHQIKVGDTAGVTRILEKLPESERNLLIKWIEQRTTEQIVKQMGSELADLEQIVETQKRVEPDATKATHVGEWDAERKRFLVQWMSDGDMM